MLNLLGLPVAASAHAGEIDHLIALVHWLMLALFLGWGTFFVFVLVRFRRGAHPTADYQGTKGRIPKLVEIGVVVVEAVLLGFYAIPVWATRTARVPPADNPVTVRVVGEQFAWNVQYPGADGQFGRTDVTLVSADNPLGLDRRDPAAKDDIVSVNLLTVPVDRPVLVHLSSKDVIHSFAVFEMRVKQDAIPGLDVPVWFVPTRIGQYDIACSQLCGLGHFRMRGVLDVKSQADYDTFLAEEARLLAP